jgi:hypothetical protein
VSTLTEEGANAGWLRMTRHALGLTVEDLAFILDVNRDHIRKVWERGIAPIPPGVVAEVERFVEFTDTIVDVLCARAERTEQPAIVVYGSPADIPPTHIASAYGHDWWDHIAFSVARKVADVYIGTARDVADVYAIPNPDDVHAHPGVLHIPATGDEAARRIARRRNEVPTP